MTLSVDFPAGRITSLVIRDVERLTSPRPLFRARLRDKDGSSSLIAAYDAASCRETADGAVYSDFPHLAGLTVEIRVTDRDGNAAWQANASLGNDEYLMEWLDFPLINLPALVDNNTEGNGGRILYPYNEGVLISDASLRQMTDFRHFESEYPSLGCYPIFPNMISSQMQAYLWEDAGLYIGAHDPTRAVKQIDFY
jgi:hypothetical protein